MHKIRLLPVGSVAIAEASPMAGDGARYSAGYDLPLPDEASLRRIASNLGFAVDDATFVNFVERARASIAALRSLQDLPVANPPTRYPRLPGGPPDPATNPHNGWSWRCDIRGADAGPMIGTTVAVKESVCVAGIPMSNGTSLLDGHVPAIDATVVTRLLDAGASIVGRATSEGLGLSSGSNTAVTGAVTNPRRDGYSVGGSSSGCAVVVAAGGCDLAVGTDQGGSIRIPAALTGIVGLKPTFGLVPYTGVLSIETSLDHVGFLARSTAPIRLALEVAAGPDGYDARQNAATSRRSDAGVTRVAVLREGVEAAGADPEVRARIDEFCAALRAANVEVDEVSVPEHALSAVVSIPVYAEGITEQLWAGGSSKGWKGWYPESEIITMARALHATPNQLPDTGKLFVLLGTYLREQHFGRYYARAQNAALALRERYDRALEGYDALLMPTCAPEPVALPLPEAPSASDVFDAGFGYHLNTAIFNLTGHPAISVPAGTIRNLPFGIMLVGHHGDDHQLLAVSDLVTAMKG